MTGHALSACTLSSMTTTMTRPRGGSALSAADLRAIEDPLVRVEKAAEVVRKAEVRADAARSMRDIATVVAHLDDGVSPVTLYRDTLECSRGLYVRIIQRAPSQRPKMDDALAQARESAQAVRRHEAVIEEARLVRDETALLLMNGGTDPVTGNKVTPVSNAEIARATGLTTARVAQVRTGTR
jgi:hypothetical protein